MLARIRVPLNVAERIWPTLIRELEVSCRRKRAQYFDSG